ncbi:MAG: 50S ribosomal protein L11 [Patescibacteria group bacterium]|nr:50S ribosomal protein L11 [Patescibacteria group bacterium]
MAKKVEQKVKLVIPAGKATPAPPVGTNLGPTGINIADFVKRFNADTAQMAGDIVPVDISIYGDRSFDYVLKTPPASSLLLKALGKDKGSGKPNTSKIGKVTKAQLREIAEKKMPDLNADNIDQAIKIIAGSARSMGIEVAG